MTTENITFNTVEEAIADIKAGRCIVVVDDENRENEGDLICAAQFATPDMINFMAVEARGLICLAMTGGAFRRVGFTPDGDKKHRQQSNGFYGEY